MAEFVLDDVVAFVEKRLGGPLTSLQARVLEDRWVQFTDGFEEARKPAPEKPSIKVSKDLRLFLEGLAHRLEGGLVTLDEHLIWPSLPKEALHGRNEVFDVSADLSMLLERGVGAPRSNTKQLMLMMFDAFHREVDVLGHPNPLRLSKGSSVDLVAMCLVAVTNEDLGAVKARLQEALKQRSKRVKE